MQWGSASEVITQAWLNAWEHVIPFLSTGAAASGACRKRSANSTQTDSLSHPRPNITAEDRLHFGRRRAALSANSSFAGDQERPARRPSLPSLGSTARAADGESAAQLVVGEAAPSSNSLMLLDEPQKVEVQLGASASTAANGRICCFEGST